jgi:hypothetical protein
MDNNNDHPSSPPSLEDLYAHSHRLRADAVACLRDGRRKLFLQGRETLRTNELVAAAAQQYNLSPEEYCQAMQEDSVWGGGPEIVALCNLLQRPIHVYELATATSSSGTTTTTRDSENTIYSRATGCGRTGFVLRRMACFGSPRFDKQRALHILSADSRFPDIRPGQQLAHGNHFLAVFPMDDLEHDGDNGKTNNKRKLRGGDIDECHLPFVKRATRKCVQLWMDLMEGTLLCYCRLC